MRLLLTEKSDFFLNENPDVQYSEASVVTIAIATTEEGNNTVRTSSTQGVDVIVHVRDPYPVLFFNPSFCHN